jgi:dihydroneopterin aldolase
VTLLSTIEFVDLPVKARIGLFANDDALDPYEHRLDLTLAVDPKLVLITEDGMNHVFDYDPLLEQIHRISQDHHYETQEMLASHILRCCATFEQIDRVEIHLKKFRPNGLASTVSGSIGVRLIVSGNDLVNLRKE